MENHSADYYRGAYHIASRYAPMDVAMQINSELAQAEARDPAPNAAAVIAQCKAAMENVTRAAKSAGFKPDQGQLNPPCHAALSAIAAWEASNGK